jgi:hypothetical protein
MVAEILAGIALAKSSVTAVKSVISTCKDINELSHHLDDLFKGHDQIKKDQVKKGNKEWNIYLTGKFKDEQEDEGSSLSDVTAEVIEQKQIEEQMKSMRNMLNKRFGQNTWDEILELRKKRIEEAKIRRKKRIAEAKESGRFWKKVMIEISKGIGIISLIFLMYWAIAVNSKVKLPWFW